MNKEEQELERMMSKIDELVGDKEAPPLQEAQDSVQQDEIPVIGTEAMAALEAQAADAANIAETSQGLLEAILQELMTLNQNISRMVE